MHRFYLPPEQCRDELTLAGREAHHGLHVLRLQKGDPVIVLDGVGGQYHAHLVASDRGSLRLKVDQVCRVPRPACQVTLLQALPKGKIFDELIHKATELGVHRIVPLLSTRVVTRLDPPTVQRKLQHWRSIAIEALKQCGAPWLAHIEPPTALPELLRSLLPADLCLVASLQPGSRHPRTCLQDYQSRHQSLPHSVAIWIGPEGDFSAEEIQSIQAAGALPITLGPLTLRVETAAIYCLSVLNYELLPPSPLLDSECEPGTPSPNARDA